MFDGRPITNRRLKVKLEYLSLGIWHRLDIHGKIQGFGRLHVNGIPLWTTKQEGTGESNWFLKYDVTYRGRCADDVEKQERNVIATPPVNNENKTRKVFWEKTRGLRYFCLIADASIYTSAIFTGPSSDLQFCAQSQAIVYSSPPALINSTSLPPFERYKIQSNIPCQ